MIARLRAIALVSLIAVPGCRRAADPPLFGLYWWYRDPPDPAERALLSRMRTTHLFVLHSEIRRGAKGALDVTAVCPLSRDEAYALVPVVRLDHEISDHVGELANWSEIEEAVVRATQDVPGVEIQLDFDCPEAALAEYAALLGRLAARRGAGVSTVALVSWLSGGRLDPLRGATSSLAILAYGGRVPQAPEEALDVGAVDELLARIDVLRRSEIPFFIGLPGYGEAWVWRGRRVGYVPQFSLDGLTEDPDFTLVAAPAPREHALSRSVTFRCRVAKLLGNVLLDPGDDVQAAYPDAARIAEAMPLLARAAGPSFRGFVFHRATHGEAGGLTLSEMAAIRGAPRLPFVLTTRYDPGLLTVELLAPPGERSVPVDALSIGITAPAPGLMQHRDGTFDHVNYAGLLDGQRVASTVRRATQIRLDEAYVSPDEKLSATIAVDGEARLRIEGTLTLPGGTRRLPATPIPAGIAEMKFR